MKAEKGSYGACRGRPDAPLLARAHALARYVEGDGLDTAPRAGGAMISHSGLVVDSSGSNGWWEWRTRGAKVPKGRDPTYEVPLV